MSRLIAVGLSVSNTDHPSTPTSHTLSESRPNAKPTPKPRPHSLYTPLSSSSPISHIRSSNLSTSSTCTTATSATRFSATSPSSVSTFFEEQGPMGHDAEQAEDAIPGVWDQLGTGELPSISIQDRLGKDEQREGTLRTLTANSSAINIDAGSTRCHRRKSRETSAASLRILRLDDDSEARRRFSQDLSTGPSLPPVSSIPGLSLAESAAMLIGGDLSPSVLTVPLSAPKKSNSNSNSNLNHESQTQVPPLSWTKRWT